MIETQSERWGIRADHRRAEAWSTTRLQFEPKGWQIEYRDALRRALKELEPADGSVLHGNYATPDHDFVDLENVLLYNVGSGAYSHLLAEGLHLRRIRSPDDRHRLSYEMDAPTPRTPESGTVLAKFSTQIGVGVAAPRSAGTWWHHLRSAVTVPHHGALHTGEFGVDIILSGLHGGRTVAGQLKPLLDGLISALQVHTPAPGVPNERTRSQLALLGDPDTLWDLLTDSSVAVLGGCSLVRPGKVNLIWNPSDHLCTEIVVRVSQAATPHIAATIRALS